MNNLYKSNKLIFKVLLKILIVVFTVLNKINIKYLN